ncbi:PemK-like, MazF-like toxin of type II toxin-antitoxin system [Quadrisphaera granulorum]|uniref:PemK-like, MazF-like toxin of type II toxin-antitoxin system n=1 Tax=Quadrisphaera granulorum TaxID=317664 RepID=A0A316AAL4_9ACTN|nr:type II toxin-antitoxin system PemK/MazF family toxin [Quadrisphaera granulorum]PWJ54592.1 PemK-like, MazF-like toxin of type II toxin-antitoxin system [Quadrisphaera granulorum]SZE95954.1 PemK-like, MazF-like toxin of type II toxin-antitoxin system [Quadrisphaera granulorum]
MAKGILTQLLDLAKAVASAARSTTPPAEPRADRQAQRPAAAPPRRPSSSSKAERPSERSRLRREPAPAPTPPQRDTGTGGARYAPEADGLPDPGEVVWAWVPYEEDASRGKDRPVLVLDVLDDGDVVGLMLTSKDHASPRTQGQRDSDGRRWMDVGTGAWDSQRRPSEVRLDRVLRLPAASVRREGAALPREIFDRVVAASRSQ